MSAAPPDTDDGVASRKRLLSLDVEAADDDHGGVSDGAARRRRGSSRSRGRSRSRTTSISFPTLVRLENEPVNADFKRRMSADMIPDALAPPGGSRTKSWAPSMSPLLASPALRRRERERGPSLEVDSEDGPQFTVRAIVAGSLIGGVVCLSNIYFGLKTSLTLGSSFTGAILGFAALAAAKGFNRRENCTLTSATNAGGGFAAGFITAIPALMWFGKDFTFLQLLAWTLSAGFLGVFYMPPLRRHMILVQQLTFPSGTATAVVISRLHAAKEDGMRKAKALLVSMVTAFLYVILTYFVPVLYNMPIFYLAGLPGAQSAGFFLNASPALFGSGVFTGLKNCLCMFGASLLAFGIIGPLFICKGPNDPYTSDAFNSGCSAGGLLHDPSNPVSMRGPTMPLMQEWWLWVSIGLLFGDQVTGIFLQYKSICAAFRFRLSADDKLEVAPPSQRVQPWMWMTGMALSSIMCVVVVTAFFDMRWWEVIVAVFFGIPLSIICIQCTGETDTTPSGAVGKMSQLLFAILTPHMPIPNLMAANIAAAGATQSTDVMQSFKTGHLLRASPKAQFFGSIYGCLVGVFASMAGWYLFRGLIPQCAPPACQSDEFPAQAAQIWYSAAKVLSQGVSALPTGVLPYAIAALVYGAIGAVINKCVAEEKRWWFPSSIAMSLGLLLGPYLPSAMLSGCLLFKVWERFYPDLYDDIGVATASGMVAGEGMAGIVQGVFGVLGIRQGALSLAGCYGYPC